MFSTNPAVELAREAVMKQIIQLVDFPVQRVGEEFIDWEVKYRWRFVEAKRLHDEFCSYFNTPLLRYTSGLLSKAFHNSYNTPPVRNNLSDSNKQIDEECKPVLPIPSVGSSAVDPIVIMDDDEPGETSQIIQIQSDKCFVTAGVEVEVEDDTGMQMSEMEENVVNLPSSPLLDSIPTIQVESEVPSSPLLDSIPTIVEAEVPSSPLLDSIPTIQVQPEESCLKRKDEDGMKKPAKRMKIEMISTSISNINGYNLRKKCFNCSSRKSSKWRNGPLGSKTLCNACGIRYKKFGHLK